MNFYKKTFEQDDVSSRCSQFLQNIRIKEFDKNLIEHIK